MPRLEVAVIHRSGDAQLVNASRPATLVAFADEFDGRMFPETPREIAWIVHRALGVAEPLDEWLEGLEDIAADPSTVKLAKRILAGDDEARAIALGEADPDEPAEPMPDPTEAMALLAEIRGASRSPA
jgi:hypothetical protein